MKKIIGFTGTHKGLSNLQFKSIVKVFKKLNSRHTIELHHGDCKGADVDITNILVNNKLIHKICVHPPTNITLRAFVVEGINLKEIKTEVYPETDYLDRNKNIVDVAELLIICPSSMEEKVKSGIWATIRMARKLNKRIITIYPNGKMDIWPNQNLIKKLKTKFKKNEKI